MTGGFIGGGGVIKLRGKIPTFRSLFSKGVETAPTDIPGFQAGGTQTYIGTKAAPSIGEPNSIWVTEYPNGNRRVTYFNEQGEPFSREDYGQDSRHIVKIKSQEVNLKKYPHEHQTRTLPGAKGPYQKKQVRILDENGYPISDWTNEK
ncbi:MAG: hypothetical protein HQM08_30630 [Candidatus Riflebacteria bacterium]|nr:hypothetical protein [Candidatus Riflebacteria bacterium]